MRRNIKIILIFIVMLFICMPSAKAATNEDLIAYVSQVFTIAGEKVTLPNSYLNCAKRYLSQYPVSENDADRILEIAKKGEKLLNDEGVYDPKKLSKAKKEELLSLGQEVAEIAGASITYNKPDKSIEIYKDGKLYDSLTVEMYKFRQTGNNNMIYIIIIAVAIIAIAVVTLYRKKSNE